ncbi:hypothetical protein RB195_018018 [Necator americanus]|uniref:Uncharacterized protein n=1 Tax=Necator americanus TaxID=51031 RepID=A0ABR1C7U9_NECAM
MQLRNVNGLPPYPSPAEISFHEWDVLGHSNPCRSTVHSLILRQKAKTDAEHVHRHRNYNGNEMFGHIVGYLCIYGKKSSNNWSGSGLDDDDIL